ncbi:MAG: primosomal protein N' [Tannerella sp.]|jgi:primosomal protein N' (replication factor Y)|nr:primosomal protein N' [Tannerella sp.]
MKYAEVILPFPLENTYTYLVPDGIEASVQTGCRVIVPFGKKRYYTAIVKETSDYSPDETIVYKEIVSVLDEGPLLFPEQLAFWQWMASYYLCKLGDVYKAAVPSGLKLESETVVTYCDDFETQELLSSKEQSVLDAFSQSPRLTVAGLEKITGLHYLIPVLNSLMKRGAVVVNEELKKGYTPKTETYIRLSPVYQDEAALSSVFEQLRRAPQQEALLNVYLTLSHPWEAGSTPEISQKELLETSKIDASVLKKLITRGVFVSYKKEISKLLSRETLRPQNKLTDAQQTACDQIRKVFETKLVCLLFGVPSCGKTEIYLHLAMDALSRGQQVLYLLPEIAVTTQITERLAHVLGNRLLVYHSGLSDGERAEAWNRLLHTDEPLLVLGVRSSLFLPFRRLGLIIVDEEQDLSYKQQDTAPRYHARNAAVMLASLYGSKALLGSATPSIESFYNARTGKYGFVKLDVRYGEGLPPRIELVNIKELRRKKMMKNALFSPLLQEKMTEALAQGEQAILLRNRRGFAPVMECQSCRQVMHCVHCDVSLTYHKRLHALVCHYCGYTVPLPAVCSCGSRDLKPEGFGTEQVEEEIASLFPEAKTSRLDMDTVRTRKAYERILADFEQGKTQILIGTQMISKGLDFEHVSVAGILNADSLMNFPDFRAHERAFQLMMQLSGRAGRRQKQGVVIVQTSQPEHPLLQKLQTFDYEGMVHLQLNERHRFHYPPYFRLITVVLCGNDESVLERLSANYAAILQQSLGERVHGPFAPPVTRVRSFHIRQILLKTELTLSIVSVRETLNKTFSTMQSAEGFKQLKVYYDVDN